MLLNTSIESIKHYRVKEKYTINKNIKKIIDSNVRNKFFLIDIHHFNIIT